MYSQKAQHCAARKSPVPCTGMHALALNSPQQQLHSLQEIQLAAATTHAQVDPLLHCGLLVALVLLAVLTYSSRYMLELAPAALPLTFVMLLSCLQCSHTPF